jgi:hypothetical protein
LPVRCDDFFELAPSQINDNYCDCKDGTDEPGTSACSDSFGARFICENKAHKSISIPSSRVGDGICDCCDGSDEAEMVGCVDSCLAAAREEREMLEGLISAYKQGSAIRASYERSVDESREKADEVTAQAAEQIRGLESQLGELRPLLLQAEEKQRDLQSNGDAEDVEQLYDILHFSNYTEGDIGLFLSTFFDFINVHPLDVSGSLSVVMGAVDEAMDSEYSGGHHDYDGGREYDYDDPYGGHEDEEGHTVHQQRAPAAGAMEAQITGEGDAVAAVRSVSDAESAAPVVSTPCGYMALAGGAGDAVEPTQGQKRTSATAEQLAKLPGDERLQHLCVVLQDQNEDERRRTVIKLLRAVCVQKSACFQLFIAAGYFLWKREMTYIRDFFYSRYQEDEVIAGAEDDPVFEAKNSCPAGFHQIDFYCALAPQYKSIMSKQYAVQAPADTQEQSNTIEMLRTRIDSLEQELREVEEKKEGQQTFVDLLDSNAEYKALVSLYGNQFSVVDGKFRYTVSVVKSVEQCDDNGEDCSTDGVNLGKFSSITPSPRKNGITQLKMHFSDGAYCHAFGPRTADIFITCGGENKVISASEPSTCYYTFEMISPAACTPQFAVESGIEKYLA